MNRKQFITEGMAGASLMLLVPTLVQSCAVEDPVKGNGKSVLIVGAGIAGLAAAVKLKQQGFIVTILEAQDKAGGRIRTSRNGSLLFEEGASWIHGPEGNPITALASQAGVNTFITDDNSVIVYDINGTAYNDNMYTEADSQYYTALTAVSNAGNQIQSFETIFNTLYPGLSVNRLWKFMLSSYLEFDTAADISQLSSCCFDDDEQFSGNDVIVTNGYDNITNLLTQNLNIKFNHMVSSINYTNSSIATTANGEVFESDYVLVTAPLGVLKTNNIQFLPALPSDKVSAVNAVKMGIVNKFMLIWDAPFWNTGLQYIGYTPETKGKFNYFLNARKYSNTNALVTFAFGNHAVQTEAMTDSEITNEIMLHLKAIYGNTTPIPAQMLRTRWGQNPHSYGSYSFATAGVSTSAFDVLANTVSNRVFFAGEHTSRQYRGTVHGAYLSGIREADKIIALQ
ncbi:MAG TPA: FAD-dependent oxidoreductase [Chitinophagales bacterium]|nr:FAD-dependent oxidoreductase [Chitinophagales bacterium]